MTIEHCPIKYVCYQKWNYHTNIIWFIKGMTAINTIYSDFIGKQMSLQLINQVVSIIKSKTKQDNE